MKLIELTFLECSYFLEISISSFELDLNKKWEVDAWREREN